MEPLVLRAAVSKPRKGNTFRSALVYVLYSVLRLLHIVPAVQQKKHDTNMAASSEYITGEIDRITAGIKSVDGGAEVEDVQVGGVLMRVNQKTHLSRWMHEVVHDNIREKFMPAGGKLVRLLFPAPISCVCTHHQREIVVLSAAYVAAVIGTLVSSVGVAASLILNSLFTPRCPKI